MAKKVNADDIDIVQLAKKLPKGPFTVHDNGAVLDQDGKMVFRIVYADPTLIAAAVVVIGKMADGK